MSSNCMCYVSIFYITGIKHRWNKNGGQTSFEVRDKGLDNILVLNQESGLSDWTNNPGAITRAQYGLGNTEWKLKIQAYAPNPNNYIEKTGISITESTFVLSFYIHYLTDSIINGDANIIKLLGSNLFIKVMWEKYSSGGYYNRIWLIIEDDNASLTTTTKYDISVENEEIVTLVVERTGNIRLWINGISRDYQTGLDIDSRYDDCTKLRAGFCDGTFNDNTVYFYLDEFFMYQY